MADSPHIARVCGTTIPAPIQSSSNTMLVRFRTDGSVSERGFMARYSSDEEAGQFDLLTFIL
jgi:cubilin